MLLMKYLILLLSCLFYFSSTTTFAVNYNSSNNKPAIQHSIRYQKINNIQDYWISEKLDGMRGFWDGKQLLSRQGNKINAPTWFIQNFPSIKMDGELWIARNNFQRLISCVRQKSADTCWKEVKFMVFDLPSHKENFSERVKDMSIIIEQISSPYLNMIKQFKLKNLNQLEKKLNDVTDSNGEGLMLHKASSYYKIGRSSSLMKLKKHQDAEAIVIEHMSGKGKYKNMLGSLKVKTPEGIVFKIGSGFSDQQRQLPPKIGSIITYKYNGKTKAGIPRFARFWRIRKTN